jgi:hypothetical protein
MGSTCYRTVYNLLFSHFLFKNVKIKIYNTVVLHVILCGRETWSIIIREEHGLRVFENVVRKRMFGPKRK